VRRLIVLRGGKGKKTHKGGSQGRNLLKKKKKMRLERKGSRNSRNIHARGEEGKKGRLFFGREGPIHVRRGSPVKTS